MTDAKKLEKIRALFEAWDEQPDPEPGEGDAPEAADVLYMISAVLDDDK